MVTNLPKMVDQVMQKYGEPNECKRRIMWSYINTYIYVQNRHGKIQKIKQVWLGSIIKITLFWSPCKNKGN